MRFFCKRDQLLLIPIIANRISLIWIRCYKHWGKETILVILWSLITPRLLRNKTQPEHILNHASLWCCEMTDCWVTTWFNVWKCLLVYMTFSWVIHSVPLLICSYVINLVIQLFKLHLSHNQIISKVVGCDSLL